MHLVSLFTVLVKSAEAEKRIGLQLTILIKLILIPFRFYKQLCSFSNHLQKCLILSWSTFLKITHFQIPYFQIYILLNVCFRLRKKPKEKKNNLTFGRLLRPWNEPPQVLASMSMHTKLNICVITKQAIFPH